MMGPKTACPAASFSIIGLRCAGLSAGNWANNIPTGRSGLNTVSATVMAASTKEFRRFMISGEFSIAPSPLAPARPELELLRPDLALASATQTETGVHAERRKN